MVLGHFGIAEGILAINKTIPALPVLIGVSYPDLVWPILVFAKKEQVRVNPKSPLGKETRFTKFPYSHSLVLSGVLTIIPSFIVALIYGRPIVGLFFFMAAISHWVLDAVVHISDMPVFGFEKEKKIGLGLWRFAKTSFFFEYGLFAVCTLLFTTSSLWVPLLIAGVILHALNANSFFGFTKENPVKSANAIATSALIGFPIMIAVFTIILTMHTK